MMSECSPKNARGAATRAGQTRDLKPADPSGVQEFPHTHTDQHRAEPGDERRVINGGKRCGIDPEREKPDRALNSPDKKTARDAEQPGRILYFPNRKKSGESITETPMRCRIPKMMNPSCRYNHVASVTSSPMRRCRPRDTGIFLLAQNRKVSRPNGRG